MIRAWRASRRMREETAVIRAIGQLRPSHASGYLIGRLAGMGPGRVHPILARLEASGRVVSGWADGPSPRRRVYRVLRAESQPWP